MINKTLKRVSTENEKVCQLVEAKFKAFNIEKRLLIQKLNDEVFELCEKEKVNEKHIRLIVGMPAPLKRKP
jgi:hypothetical protein